jgi:chromosome segregation ATPase
VHLKSISLKGFKSFPDRVTLPFSPGVSVIVGPNGSGKSNITDAVLWALGEQSPLAVRGETMQDVISVGGPGRGRRNAAEVEVVIDNSEGRADSDFSEISITRRLGRNGEGEYRLNGARCRLIDVIEVLSDTNLGKEMHSVVSQGRVEEIVLSKPGDRRLLIEEAAGLGKHRKRRRRTQLKLERTQENLDRALDVEREARARLRPLKRQAEAADLHARILRQSLELRADLRTDDLRSLEAELGGAESGARDVRARRDEIEVELARVAARRDAIEQQFADRDRRRHAASKSLIGLQVGSEKLTLRLESLVAKREELEARAENRRRTLAALGGAPRPGDDPATALESGLEAIGASLRSAASALERLRAGTPASEDAGRLLAEVRTQSEKASQQARAAELLLGQSQAAALERRMAMEERLVEQLGRLTAAAGEARDAAAERAAGLERQIAADEVAGQETAAELRACSKREYELQSQLHAGAEAVTQAEVAATQLRDRHREVAGEVAEIGSALGLSLGPAAEALGEPERDEIQRKLERLERRREQLGPVNPLAKREYDEARAHVEELEIQRGDLEAAMSELGGLIRETDAKIRKAFDETFDAAARNFEEMVEHLFPGGRGRLRLVQADGPRPVIGGVEPGPDGGEEAPPRWAAGEPVAEDDAAERDEEEMPGVEVEVAPAGKSTRRLSLLSGGEKSLVALAFMFAVFLARPCPFYILDEVEAALDDANIDRFLQILRRYSERAQFIVVTHQKRTMDAADVLYGVTMGDDGVTKVISRRLPQDEGAEASAEESAEERAA